MNIPENLLYTKSDEWLRRESDGTLTIGVTDHAQNELGEIVYIELPEIGKSLEDNATFGVVESVKSVSELHAPIAGEVVAINKKATESPDVINASPYTDGWLIRIRPEQQQEALTSFMDAAAYTKYRS